ncbi:MAG TPA: hypothetical protein VM802_04625 [Chitinophaga sp.]|nr:hypothetical protein [Chitinophaga sp.]HVI44124.1 hypothetical protein [Chitinophaga sp.]
MVLDRYLKPAMLTYMIREDYTVPETNGQIQLYRSYPGTGKVVSLAYRER